MRLAGYNCTMPSVISSLFSTKSLTLAKNKKLITPLNQHESELPYCPVLFDKLELPNEYF